MICQALYGPMVRSAAGLVLSIPAFPLGRVVAVMLEACALGRASFGQNSMRRAVLAQLSLLMNEAATSWRDSHTCTMYCKIMLFHA